MSIGEVNCKHENKRTIRDMHNIIHIVPMLYGTKHILILIISSVIASWSTEKTRCVPVIFASAPSVKHATVSYRGCTVSRFGHFAAGAEPRAIFIDRTSGFPFIDGVQQYQFDNLNGVHVPVMVITTGTETQRNIGLTFVRLTKIYNSVDESARQ